MIFVYDEQILASIYCLLGWKKVVANFLENLFYSSNLSRILAASGIVWLHRSKDKPFWEKYSEYFEKNTTIIHVLKERQEIYQAFLDSLPKDIQVALATHIAALNLD